MKRMVVLLFVFALLIGLCGCQTPVVTNMTAPTQAATNPPANHTAKISGSFTVTVRNILPDYLLDDSTPSVAVVTPYQSNLFALDVSYEIASQLEVGKTYVFTVKPVFADYSVDMLHGLGTAALFALIPALEVDNFRLADENEIGLYSLQLTIE